MATNITPYLTKDFYATIQFKTGVTTVITLTGDKSGVSPVGFSPTTGVTVIPSQSDFVRRASTQMSDGGTLSIPMVLGDHNKDMLNRLGQTATLTVGPNGNTTGALKRTCDVIVTGTPVTVGRWYLSLVFGCGD